MVKEAEAQKISKGLTVEAYLDDPIDALLSRKNPLNPV